MVRILHSMALGLAALGASGCGQAPQSPSAQVVTLASPAERLARLVERYWDEYQRQNPDDLPQGAAVRYDAADGYDISAQFLADRLALERRYLAALTALSRPALDADSQLTYDIFKRGRELAIESLTYPSELLPVNPYRCLAIEVARTGAGVGPYAILTPQDYEHWQARMRAFVRWTGQAIDNMRSGMRRGYTLPRVLVEETLPILAALGEDAPGNLFYQPSHGIPATLAEPERTRLSNGITALVRDEILPAYRRMHDFLQQEYLPRARSSVGLAALPLGDAWYAFVIKRETDTAETPAALHALGVAAVESLRQRLERTLAETAFAGNAAGFLESLRQDPHASFKTPEELAAFYEELEKQAAAGLPTLFSAAPSADFALRPLQGFREAFAPPLDYQRAPRHGHGSAVLYMNTRGMPDAPVLAQPARFLRETLPGFHYQLSVQAARAQLPRFRRFGGDPAFVEGWGLYAASLGETLGVYRDAAAKFAAVLGQLQCAVGLVIDTGLHAQAWSREQAIAYVAAQLPLGVNAARDIVDRALALPGEALACGMGERSIQALRARAEQALGPRFDVQAFHTELLNQGAMPMDILESRMALWLNDLH